MNLAVANAQAGASVPKMQVDIGGLNFAAPTAQNCPTGTGQCYQIDWIGKYIAAIFQYGISLAAVLAVVMIMIGGFVWLTSGGSPDKVGKAKEYISNALLGLLLALLSYTMLYAINPRLVFLDSLTIQKTTEQKQACCVETDTNKGSLQYAPDGDCTQLGYKGQWQAGTESQCGLQGCCDYVDNTTGYRKCIATTSEKVCDSLKSQTKSGYTPRFLPGTATCLDSTGYLKKDQICSNGITK